ncbi:hypothetical protein XPA_009048 [Xanthoria parietina]
MALSTAYWDPYHILRIDKDRTKCYGQTLKNQHCGNSINAGTRYKAQSLLSRIGAMDPSQDSLDNGLHDLAKMLLCRRHHEQALIVNGKWKEALVGYCTTTTCRRRSTSHHSGQTELVFAIENEEDWQIPGQHQEPSPHQEPSQQPATDRIESTSPHGQGTPTESASDETLRQPQIPSQINSQVGISRVNSNANFETVMSTVQQRREYLRLYRDKAAIHQRAVETAAAAQQDMDMLSELLDGIEIEEFFDPLSMEPSQALDLGPAPSGDGATAQGVTPNHHDGIKGDCGICKEDLQDRSTLVCCKEQCGQYLHWRCMDQWWLNDVRKRCPLCRAPWVEEQRV